MIGLAWFKKVSTTIEPAVPKTVENLIKPLTNKLEPSFTESPTITRREASEFPKELNILLLVEDPMNPLPNTTFQRTQEALARRFEAIIQLPIEQRNSKNKKITQADVDLIRDYKETGEPFQDSLVYERFIKQIYNELRLHPYLEAETVGFDSNIAEKTDKHIYYTAIEFSNANIEFIADCHKVVVADMEDGWHRRYFPEPPTGLRTKPVKKQKSNTGKQERLSVNAIGCQGLIDALDAVFTTHGISGNYKVPSTANRWHNRHDPITIYLDEEATPEALALIESAVKPYIRSTQDVLPGRIIIPGLVLETIPTSAKGKALISRAHSLNEALGVAISKFLNKAEKDSMSSGMLKATELALQFLSPSGSN